MKRKPEYFEPIRLRASRRWDQLEQDPELAGPWHQLFKQVQSPRHVLSELLQNADDAGATEASVRIENRTFIFEHNGDDFRDQDFACLCRFGYSNKRSMHTIGFRGIGFKSTFSLGDDVELLTPTLAVRFGRQRFTEPHWLSQESETSGRTQICVQIRDEHRQREVEKNLDEWLKSPMSLLFFRNIRQIKIGDRVVNWHTLRNGPVPRSEWMTLREQNDRAVLLIRSDERQFPEEALAEIRQERMLQIEEQTDFPPCNIEIVLGAKGQLFVVLPTGVGTELPFACNAPFIQDPARLKIKDPETSPTNRWLLECAGQVAASAMLEWMADHELPIQDRAAAYGLYPDVDRANNSLEGVCGTIVEKAFAVAVSGRPLLLTEEGQLTRKKESVIIPTEIANVWPARETTALFDDMNRPALCQHITAADRKKLMHWGLVEEIDKQKILYALQNKHLPKPTSWRRLLDLWAYIAPQITGYWPALPPNTLRVVPVQGKDVLYASSEVVRLSERKLLESEDDWNFLAARLLVFNQNWIRFLAEQRRTALEDKDSTAQQIVQTAYAVLKAIQLEETSDVTAIMDRVAKDFFSQKSVALAACIHLAQIAAKLNAAVGSSFRYVTRDRLIRSTEKVLLDEAGTLEALIPQQQWASTLLHQDYLAGFSSCSPEDWRSWVSKGYAGLRTFVPLVQRSTRIYGRGRILEEARRRGLEHEIYFRYVTDTFVIEDWDFEEIYWRNWEGLAREDDRLWTRVFDCILAQPDVYRKGANAARILQVATTGTKGSVTTESLLPGWLLRLRELPCLRDTRGFPKKPRDLLRRTSQTESLIDFEPFIEARIDREAMQPLLNLLGVRVTPTGPNRLLECARALTKAENPPVLELDKLYRRLDQMLQACGTPDAEKIKDAFRSEKLIYTQDGGWTCASGVYVMSDEEDVPGAATIRPSVAELSLWRQIGVAERPTADLAIQWLKELPTGRLLSHDDVRRVRSLLARHPVRIWNECAHWLNLAGEWVPTQELTYALTMQSLLPWGHLHPWVKQKTADLQRLQMAVTNSLPFSAIPVLAACLEERFERNPVSDESSEPRDWLAAIGTELCRIELETEEETARVRSIGLRLSKTKWFPTSQIETIPYIDGTPAGTPRKTDILWSDFALYVSRLPKAKLARRVPEELGKVFGREDIKAALDYSFERSPEDVREYLEENFELGQDVCIHEMENDDGAAVSAKEQVADALGDKLERSDQSFVVNGADEETQECNATEAGDEESAPATLDGDEQDMTNALEERPVRAHSTTKAAKPSVIECFAKAQGFRKDSDERFFHDDGSWIGRAKGARFPWERRSATGDLVRYYWPKDHCLEHEPLQVEADIWALIDQHPEAYALILLNGEGATVELTGARLRAMRDGGEVTLYPAAYRLVYNYDRHP